MFRFHLRHFLFCCAGSSVHNLPEPIEFLVPISTIGVCESLSSVHCISFATSTGSWTAEGCNSSLVNVTSSGSLAIQCSCTHASDFATFTVRAPQYHPITRTSCCSCYLSCFLFALLFSSSSLIGVGILFMLCLCVCMCVVDFVRFVFALFDLQNKISLIFHGLTFRLVLQESSSSGLS
jgi:hypothetical protein